MSTDRRDSYRCPTETTGQSAVLGIGRKQVIVDLVDQSLGGFAISTSRRIRIKPGQIVMLRTSMGWSEVEVMRVKQVADEMRIGLRRLNDLPDPRQEAALQQTSLPQLKVGRSLQASGGLLPALLGLVLLAIVIFWIAASHVLWWPPIQDWWKQHIRSAPPSAKVESTH